MCCEFIKYGDVKWKIRNTGKSKWNFTAIRF